LESRFFRSRHAQSRKGRTSKTRKRTESVKKPGGRASNWEGKGGPNITTPARKKARKEKKNEKAGRGQR